MKERSEQVLTFFAQSSSLAGSLRLISKSGSAKSHPVETQAYRSRQKINQNSLLLNSSSCQLPTGGIILVRLRLGVGALPAIYRLFVSSSTARPKWTAERVNKARIPHDDGPCSEPIRSRARRARACTESIDVDSIAWARICCLAAALYACFVEGFDNLISADKRRETTTMA